MVTLPTSVLTYNKKSEERFKAEELMFTKVHFYCGGFFCLS